MRVATGGPRGRCRRRAREGGSHNRTTWVIWARTRGRVQLGSFASVRPWRAAPAQLARARPGDRRRRSERGDALSRLTWTSPERPVTRLFRALTVQDIRQARGQEIGDHHAARVRWPGILHGEGERDVGAQYGRRVVDRLLHLDVGQRRRVQADESAVVARIGIGLALRRLGRLIDDRAAACDRRDDLQRSAAAVREPTDRPDSCPRHVATRPGIGNIRETRRETDTPGNTKRWPSATPASGTHRISAAVKRRSAKERHRIIARAAPPKRKRRPPCTSAGRSPLVRPRRVYSTRKFVSSAGVLVSEFELLGMNGSVSVAVTDAVFDTFPPTVLVTTRSMYAEQPVRQRSRALQETFVVPEQLPCVGGRRHEGEARRQRVGHHHVRGGGRPVVRRPRSSR